MAIHNERLSFPGQPMDETSRSAIRRDVWNSYRMRWVVQHSSRSSSNWELGASSELQLLLQLLLLLLLPLLQSIKLHCTAILIPCFNKDVRNYVRSSSRTNSKESLEETNEAFWDYLINVDTCRRLYVHREQLEQLVHFVSSWVSGWDAD